jgi:hypothetical protein
MTTEKSFIPALVAILNAMVGKPGSMLLTAGRGHAVVHPDVFQGTTAALRLVVATLIGEVHLRLGGLHGRQRAGRCGILWRGDDGTFFTDDGLELVTIFTCLLALAEHQAALTHSGHGSGQLGGR